MIVYYDEQFIEQKEAKIPISDRGFLFGDGAYATIQVREGIPLFLEMHLKQLCSQCHSFHIKMPYVDHVMIERLIELNKANRGIWRLKIVVSGGDLSEMALPVRQGRVLIFITPFDSIKKEFLECTLFSTPFYLCHASFKTLAHLNRFYVMEEAKQKGVDDCVTTTERGILLEASFGNLFWVKGDHVYTPHPSLPLYFGVTIQNVLGLAQKMGYKTELIQLTLSQLPEEALCFRVNTMHGLCPVERIGDKYFCQERTLIDPWVQAYEALIEEQKKTALRGAVLCSSLS